METLITQKTALLAKEKGFDYNPEYYFYPNDKRDGYNILHKNHCFGGDTRAIEYHYLKGDYSLVIPAPAQSILAKWLREVHDIKISVSFYDDGKNQYWTCFIHIRNQREQSYICGKDVFEEAFEEGLFEGLKLVY